MKLYAIKDNLVGFNAPYVQPNNRVAERTFAKVAKESDITESLELWYLGEMDEKTGELIPEVPEFMKGGAEYVHVAE